MFSVSFALLRVCASFWDADPGAGEWIRVVSGLLGVHIFVITLSASAGGFTKRTARSHPRRCGRRSANVDSGVLVSSGRAVTIEGPTHRQPRASLQTFIGAVFRELGGAL